MPDTLLATQTTGNIGRYYVCYRLSQLGWNVMPTSRNARGIDILLYSQDGKRTRTVQVKALSRRAAVPLGHGLDHLIADFVIVCRGVHNGQPECFVLTPREVRRGSARQGTGAKASYWLSRTKYEAEQFREKWRRVGPGAAKGALAQ